MGAVAAAAAGASVLVLEKAGSFGGTTCMSGVGVGIPLTDVAAEAGVVDSRDDVVRYYQTATAGRVNMDMANGFIDNGNAYLNWEKDILGVTRGWTGKSYQDYYEPDDGCLQFGRGAINVIDMPGGEGQPIYYGSQVWPHVEQTYYDFGGETLFNTAAQELVCDENGAVVGVRATDADGNDLYVRANKGVLLGTGGFDHNQEMRRQYLVAPIVGTVAAPGNTGDGQRMGAAIGAKLSNMDRVFGTPHFVPADYNSEELVANWEVFTQPSYADWATYRGLPGAVVVNRKGRRIGDESQVYSVFNHAFGNYDNGTCEFVNLPAYFICGGEYLEHYRLPTMAEVGDEVPEFFAKADTLEELAGKLGIDVEGFMDEMAAFNEGAKAGVDPVWHRGERSISVNSYRGLGDRPDLPNPMLAPLEQGPFYGCAYVSGSCGTSGGLVTDGNAQVVSQSGDLIPGLYASGCCSCGVAAGTYVHGGIPVGQGSVMSWVAVRHMLGLDA